ncbi:MAG: hypothetical protein D6775_03420 [Caldilineae bacterium]|nr:MAG: hypothetical protein D6775_03420 [Caldilineae bacterium]
MPTSLPALAVQIAYPDQSWPCYSVVQNLLKRPFVPAYRVPYRGPRERRICRLADAVALLAERLERLSEVYPYWRRFEPGPYFDLRPEQLQAMVRIERLGATLDVTIHADLLSPAFRTAERYWAQTFCPAYHAASNRQDDSYTIHFFRHTLPAMQRRMQAAREEIAAAGELLFQRGDTTFLASAAAPDERERHLQRLPPGDEDLYLVFNEIPTLTLSRSFDLLQLSPGSTP